MRVLLIEDDPIMARNLKLMLRAERFHVHATDLGEDGIDLGKHYSYDIVVLDLGLPDISGFNVLRALRAARIHRPILVLSGDANVDTKIRALELGADGYMTKPFHKDELLARMRGFVRRSEGHAQSSITSGKITVDIDARTVQAGGNDVNVTAKEFQLLELLSLKRGTTLSKEAFHDYLYGDADGPETGIIELFMCKLRKKLAAATHGDKCIETVGYRGYLLRASAE